MELGRAQIKDTKDHQNIFFLKEKKVEDLQSSS